MDNEDATSVARTIRPNRYALVGLLGLGTIGVGFLVPVAATPPDADGVHKSYVCKYVDKPGEPERLQSGQNPIWVDNAAIMLGTGRSIVAVGDSFRDGQFRSVVIVANSPKLDPEPGIEQCPGFQPPPTTTTTTPTETTTTPTETTTTTPTETTTTTTPTGTTTTTTPTETTMTTPSGTGSQTATGTGTSTGGGGSTVVDSPGTVGGGGTVVDSPGTVGGGGVGSAVGAGATSSANAVPLAATDGADLQSGGAFRNGLRGVLFAGGALMLGGGLFGLRRKAQL